MKLLFQLLVLVLPTQLSLHFWPTFSYVLAIRVDYLAPAIYLLDIVFVMFVASWLIKDKQLVFKTLKNSQWLILLLIALAVINTLFSSLPLLTLYKWFRVFELFVLYLYIKSTPHVIKLMFTPLSFAAAFTLFLGLAQIASHGSLGGVFYWLGERAFSQGSPSIALATIFGNELLRPYATFSHPNTLAGFSLVAFFILAKSKLTLHRLGAIASFLLVILSFSQNAWISLLLTPMLFFIIKKPKLRFKIFLFSLVLISLLLPFVNLYSSDFPREIAERLDLAAISGRVVATSPVVGVGLGGFIHFIPSFSLSTNPIWFLQPVHNLFLLLATEVGAIGLILFITFILKSTNRVNLALVIAILLTGMWDHYWLTQIQTMFLGIIAIGLNKKSL